MPSFSSNPIVFLVIGVCAFLIIAKLLKVEKGAGVFVLAVVILGLALYFTGYDKTLYRIIFEAPPVQPQDYRYRQDGDQQRAKAKGKALCPLLFALCPLLFALSIGTVN
jgi:hypothetical protein